MTWLPASPRAYRDKKANGTFRNFPKKRRGGKTGRGGKGVHPAPALGASPRRAPVWAAREGRYAAQRVTSTFPPRAASAAGPGLVAAPSPPPPPPLRVPPRCVPPSFAALAPVAALCPSRICVRSTPSAPPPAAVRQLCSSSRRARALRSCACRTPRCCCSTWARCVRAGSRPSAVHEERLRRTSRACSRRRAHRGTGGTWWSPSRLADGVAAASGGWRRACWRRALRSASSGRGSRRVGDGPPLPAVSVAVHGRDEAEGALAAGRAALRPDALAHGAALAAGDGCGGARRTGRSCLACFTHLHLKGD